MRLGPASRGDTRPNNVPTTGRLQGNAECLTVVQFDARIAMARNAARLQRRELIIDLIHYWIRHETVDHGLHRAAELDMGLERVARPAFVVRALL